ncbi:hypothetical protein [Thauera chlorobenzoica]|uniref:hypothetical protein n=1 Tax=Thauera chlorobenzoica TaxID=96773 RepID=UPI0011B0DDE7|nr:hypothetical protein [Thauera chlorobenzoica]
MRITIPMYEKGRSFVMAGGLVKAYEGHRFVYLHLLCQGLECIGKALLLAHDYGKYEPILRKDFGHDLEVLVAEVDRNAGGPFLSSQSTSELKLLNAYYKRHMLRYGDAGDFNKESLQVCADHLHSDLVNCLTELNEIFATEKGDA